MSEIDGTRTICIPSLAFNYVDNRLESIGYQGELYVRQYTHFFGYPITEEIVRCRDCKHYDDEPDLGSSGPKCWRDPDHRGTPIWTRPDGFCAWGERRGDAE